MSIDTTKLDPKVLAVIEGQRFSMLTVLGLAGRHPKSRKAFWLCKCDCGRESIVCGHKLKSQKTKSCGCLRAKAGGDSLRTHGMSGSPIHRIWKGMIARCCCPTQPGYPGYGGRGIRVCERWKTFENFYSDMGDRPNGMSLDRINNERNYEPGNCRWATNIEQSNNRRSNRLVTLDEITLSIADWARLLGVDPMLIRGRLNRGWEVVRAFFEPSKTNHLKAGAM